MYTLRGSVGASLLENVEKCLKQEKKHLTTKGLFTLFWKTKVMPFFAQPPLLILLEENSTKTIY